MFKVYSLDNGHDKFAFHSNVSNEYLALPVPSAITSDIILSGEDPNNEGKKIKILISDITEINDEDAFHYNIPLEFTKMPMETNPIGTERLAVESGVDGNKRQILISSMKIDSFSINSNIVLDWKSIVPATKNILKTDGLYLTDLRSDTNLIHVYSSLDLSQDSYIRNVKTPLALDWAANKGYVDDYTPSIERLPIATGSVLDWKGVPNLEDRITLQTDDLQSRSIQGIDEDAIAVPKGLDISGGKLTGLTEPETATEPITKGVFTDDQYDKITKFMLPFYTMSTLVDETAWYQLTETIIDTNTIFGRYSFILMIKNIALDDAVNSYKVTIDIQPGADLTIDSLYPVIKIEPLVKNSPINNNYLDSVVITNPSSIQFQMTIYFKINRISEDSSISIKHLPDTKLFVANDVIAKETIEPGFIIDTINYRRNTIMSNLSNSGSVKIESNVGGLKPTLILLADVEQQVEYSNPLLSASFFPPEYGCDKTGPGALYYTDLTKGGIFLENQIIGQPQFFRINYSISAGAGGFWVKIRMQNPISLFDIVKYTRITDITDSEDISVDFILYSDKLSASPEYGGNGLGGYQIFIEATDDITVVMESITRLNSQF